MSIEEAFGQVIKDLQRKRGLTRADIRELTGLSHNGLWEIRTGRAGPRLAMMFKLADALQVAPEELIRRTSIEYRDQRT